MHRHTARPAPTGQAQVTGQFRQPNLGLERAPPLSHAAGINQTALPSTKSAPRAEARGDCGLPKLAGDRDFVAGFRERANVFETEVFWVVKERGKERVFAAGAELRGLCRRLGFALVG